MADWYDNAKKEFMLDLWTFNDVDPDAAQRVYSYLVNEGLIEYDVEKEFLYDNYVDGVEDDRV